MVTINSTILIYTYAAIIIVSSCIIIGVRRVRTCLLLNIIASKWEIAETDLHLYGKHAVKRVAFRHIWFSKVTFGLGLYM